VRILRLLGVVALAAALGGCIASTTLVNVKPDGSGTIEQTITMNPMAAAQLQAMAAGFGQRGQKDAQPGGSLFTEADMRAAAGKLGEGVTFVSSEPIRTQQAEGIKAIYAFTDITKVRLDEKPAPPGGGAKGMPAIGGSAPEVLFFKFAKTPAGTLLLTAVFPETKIDPSRARAGANAVDAQSAQAMAMIRPLLNGLRLSLAVQPAGRIVRTSSPYVEGQKVTLLDIDFAQLLSDEALLQRLQGVGSLEEAKALLKGRPGVKINLDREVTIEFAGK